MTKTKPDSFKSFSDISASLNEIKAAQPQHVIDLFSSHIESDDSRVTGWLEQALRFFNINNFPDSGASVNAAERTLNDLLSNPMNKLDIDEALADSVRKQLAVIRKQLNIGIKHGFMAIDVSAARAAFSEAIFTVAEKERASLISRFNLNDCDVDLPPEIEKTTKVDDIMMMAEIRAVVDEKKDSDVRFISSSVYLVKTTLVGVPKLNKKGVDQAKEAVAIANAFARKNLGREVYPFRLTRATSNAYWFCSTKKPYPIESFAFADEARDDMFKYGKSEGANLYLKMAKLREMRLAFEKEHKELYIKNEEAYFNWLFEMGKHRTLVLQFKEYVDSWHVLVSDAPNITHRSPRNALARFAKFVTDGGRGVIEIIEQELKRLEIESKLLSLSEGVVVCSNRMTNHKRVYTATSKEIAAHKLEMFNKVYSHA
jgi:hypothetical protein